MRTGRTRLVRVSVLGPVVDPNFAQTADCSDESGLGKCKSYKVLRSKMTRQDPEHTFSAHEGAVYGQGTLPG